MRNEFTDRLKEFIRQICKKELEEITTTGDVDGYSTPFAFADTNKGYRKKKKKRVHEELEKQDLTMIKELIRRVIADVIRDIWLKRNTWN